MTENLQRQISIRRETTERCYKLCSSSCFLASAVNLERELFKDLMKGYNKHVRPTEKSGDITQVHIKMTLTNLISLVSKIELRGLILPGTLTTHSRRRCFKISVLQKEKDEALTTSVWIELVVKHRRLDFSFPLLCLSV